MIGICHECCRVIDTSKCIEIQKDIFECNLCEYPNHINQLVPVTFEGTSGVQSQK